MVEEGEEVRAILSVHALGISPALVGCAQIRFAIVIFPFSVRSTHN
jgi:hypothetical protein